MYDIKPIKFVNFHLVYAKPMIYMYLDSKTSDYVLNLSVRTKFHCAVSRTHPAGSSSPSARTRRPGPSAAAATGAAVSTVGVAAGPSSSRSLH